MDTSLQLSLLCAISILTMICLPTVTAVDGPLESSMPTTVPSSPAPTPQELQEHSFFSHTALLPPILSQLGFQNLATAAPLLSDPASSAASSWTGPSTIFAPSDASLRTCYSCSVPDVLREHIIPGYFTMDYLRKLAFGTKIETLSPGHCITVTNDSINRNSGPASDSRVFIGGMEITQPELFNNGMVVVHGIQGYVSPLSPFSCDVERMSSHLYPYHLDHRSGQHIPSGSVQPPIMRLMARDAILRLRNNGFSVLALAMKVKYPELVTLNNMTIFAVDDLSIFSGSHSYISNVKFHIVPNHYLTLTDLEKLPLGTPLPTLERGQTLFITNSGGGLTSSQIRINYVRVKVPDVTRNTKIVVHSVYLPFPHISPVTAAYDSMVGGEGAAHSSSAEQMMMEGTCTSTDGNGNCSEPPIPQAKLMVEIEDQNGL